MNAEKYFGEIGLVGEFYEKAMSVIDSYESLYGEVFTHVCISEYMDGNGVRNYESLWLFSDSLACEAKNFLSKDSYDAAVLRGKVDYIEANKTNFYFDNQEVAPDSRLTLHFRFGPSSVSGDLKASKENCIQLLAVFNECIKPNLTA